MTDNINTIELPEPQCEGGQSGAHGYISSSERTTLVSFSGGETSAYMSAFMKNNSKNKLVFVFANTGQENEETLRFVERCDNYFGLDVVWVEAVVNAVGTGTSHKIVDFRSASRNGEPFEAVMAQYGISNKAYPHCTRELKNAPIHSYMKTIAVDYYTAIGIRADEYRRVKDIKGIIYPIADAILITKEDVKEYWRNKPFALGLQAHQGNCKWCWKKSLRKHCRLIFETPKIYDFPREMENLYGKVRCPEGRRVFFRETRSTDDLFAIQAGNVQPALFDLDAGCTESCEMYEAI